MSRQRRATRLLDASLAHLPRFKPSDWKPYDPTAGTVAGSFTLDEFIAEGKADPVRWAFLDAEWSAKP